MEEAAVESAVEAVSFETECASLYSLAGSPGEGFNLDCNLIVGQGRLEW